MNILKTFLKILKGIVTAFLLIVLLLVIFQKLTNNRLTIGNVYIFQVASASMVPEYKIGDIIVVKKVGNNDLNIGDDVTYLGKSNNLKGLTITHRIIAKEEREGTYYYTTKGIANEISDPEIDENDIYGKVAYHTIIFSFVGRAITNIVIYYLSFIIVGVAFSYEVITSFFLKDKGDDNEEEETV